ncbi:MAG: hypothetical protein J6C97_01190 [Clostridia bacterium]|nr:hypothetical protein [Clostridia bacterium]
MKTKKLLTMVISIMLMLILSISVVGCKDGGAPTQETDLYNYSKTLNAWHLNETKNMQEFQEQSLNLNYEAFSEDTEEYEYYEQEGDTEMVTKTHTSTMSIEIEGSFQFKKVGEDYFAYSILKGTSVQNAVYVDSTTNLLKVNSGTLFHEVEYRLGVISGDTPTYYLSCKDIFDVTSSNDQIDIQDSTSYTYKTYGAKEDYLSDFDKLYNLFINYKEPTLYSFLDEDSLGLVLNISDTSNLTQMDWMGYCVEANSPFIPLFLADTANYYKTGNEYSCILNKCLNMMIGPIGSMFVNLQYGTNLTETQLNSSSFKMDMIGVGSSLSKSSTSQKIDFSKKTTFKPLSSLNDYQEDTSLSTTDFFDANLLFGE